MNGPSVTVGRHFDGPIEIGKRDDVIARDPFLRLGKRSVRYNYLARPHGDGGRVLDRTQPVTVTAHSPRFHLGHPFHDIVLGGDIFRRCRVVANEKHVLHDGSFLSVDTP
jgi:hypothetical protein